MWRWQTIPWRSQRSQTIDRQMALGRTVDSGRNEVVGILATCREDTVTLCFLWSLGRRRPRRPIDCRRGPACFRSLRGYYRITTGLPLIPMPVLVPGSKARAAGSRES